MDVSIEVRNTRVVLDALRLAGRYADQGLSRAVNDSARRLRTRAVRIITGEVTLKSGYVRERLRLTPARTGAPVAIVSGRARETRLDRFKHRQLFKRGKGGKRKPAGIAVQVKRSGAQKVLKQAFLVRLNRGAVAGAGGLAIAQRLKGAARAYEVLYSSSVRDLYNDALTRHGLADEIRSYLVQRIEQEAARAIARATR